MPKNLTQEFGGRIGRMAKLNTEDSSIVCNGGWIEQKCRNKPRARLFTLLTVFWLFPSFGALVIIGGDFVRWFREPTLLEGIRAVAFERMDRFRVIGDPPGVRSLGRAFPTERDPEGECHRG